MDERNVALEAIRKKLIGKRLTYKEIYAIMDQIASDRLGNILTTYFVASGYSKGFSNEELYFLTSAMVKTGEKLSFSGIVADKHSIGGLPGTRTTLIVVPIIAACGFKIPKSSSRAITTPAGTADVMEVLAKVTFTKRQLYDIVSKANGCIVWGGSFNIAPADDEIIKIEEPLLFESFDKILVSVMAKKIAFGSNHIVIDIPYGKTVKVHSIEDALLLAEKFEYLAKRFHIKLKAIISHVLQPAGRGIGPVLEAREALKVLERKQDRSLDLETKALTFASSLLSLCLEDAPALLQKEIKNTYKDTKAWAYEMLSSGKAHSKMKEIIACQQGDPDISSADLVPGVFAYSVKSEKSGKIISINNKNITIIAKLLGAPQDKKAGIYFYKRLYDHVDKGEGFLNLYSQSKYNLSEACDSLPLFPICDVS